MCRTLQQKVLLQLFCIYCVTRGVLMSHVPGPITYNKTTPDGQMVESAWPERRSSACVVGSAQVFTLL